MRASAAAVVDCCGDVEVTIDGRPVNDATRYRSTTSVFSMTLPADNVAEYFGCSIGAGTYGPCISDGYMLLLTPRTPGDHLIDEKLVQHVVPGDPSQDLHFDLSST